jgi:hypothetical protein
MSNPRDYADTKSWLAYEQNPYSTHWVRSDSCHRKTSLAYNILSTITWVRANTNIFDDCHTNLTSPHYDNTSMLRAQGLRNLTTTSTTSSCSAIASMTLQHRRQHDSTYTSRRDQVTLAAPSPAWLGNTVISMIRHLHHVADKSPRQCHC